MGVKINILNYKMGNIRSVYNALKHLGAKPVIATNPSEVKVKEKMIIPGVGAFGAGIKNLKPFSPVIKEASASGTPLLGICLGLQMCFEGSEESPEISGLGITNGKVERIKTKLRLPHIGWNSLEITKRDCPLFKGINNGFVYFVHSYHPLPKKDLIAATTNYGCVVTASVWKDNVYGTQFHPEKSGITGLQILKNFLEV